MRNFKTGREMYTPSGRPLYPGYPSAQSIGRIGLFDMKPETDEAAVPKKSIARAVLKRNPRALPITDDVDQVSKTSDE